MANEEAHFTLAQTANSLVVTPQGALCQQQIELIRQSVLNKLQKEPIKAVIVNLAGVPILDSVEFDGLRKTLNMTALMGAKAILVGIHFGIASALAQMDIDMKALNIARDVDEAILSLKGH